MASRWIRWHLTTHIWEYSTDNGSNWAPLPLNAAILTEGTINPARLPPGLPSSSGDNVFTGTNPLTLQNTGPALIFNETDQAVDQKKSSLIVQDRWLQYAPLTDAGAYLPAVLQIFRGGQINSSSSSSHTFQINRAGPSFFVISNPDAGTGTHLDLTLANNLGNRLYLRTYSSNFTDRCEFTSLASLGLSIHSTSGNIEFYTGGAKRAQLDPSGNLVIFSGYLYANVGIVEYGRPVTLGQWQNIAHNAAYFTAASATWTVDPGDLVAYRYTIIGKTVIMHFSAVTTSISAATAWLGVALPIPPSTSINFQSTIYRGDVGWLTGYSVLTAGDARAIIYGNSGAGAWPALANAAYVNFDISYSIA